MILSVSAFVTLGLSLFIFIAFFRYYWNTIRKLSGIPVYHVPLYLLNYQITKKTYASFTNYAIEKITEKCMLHMKEGLAMTYFPGPILFIFGEEPVKVFSNTKAATDKPDSLYHVFQDMVGPGLITNNGEKWKKLRKMLNPTFSPAALKEKVPLFNEHALAFVKDLEILVGKPSVDLTDFIKCHFFNTLSESVLGLKQTEENKVENLKYFHNMDTLGASAVYRVAHPWFRRKFMLRTFSYGRQILREHEESLQFTRNAILKMKEHISSNQPAGAEGFSKDLRNSFAYVLLQHHMNDPSFTFEDLHGQVRNFMVAGYDTTSYAMLWCLFMLGLYPEIQEKAYNEVEFTSVPNYISFEDCSNFTYLEAVILETLRLYPTAPIFPRQLTEDVQCGKRTIPKDTIIVFISYVTHRNSDIYPDPERFLGTKPIKPWTYIPFGEGYRNCIGKRYTLLELKIFLAHFLRKYKITSLDRREDVGLCWNVVLAPAKPIHMHIELR